MLEKYEKLEREEDFRKPLTVHSKALEKLDHNYFTVEAWKRLRAFLIIKIRFITAINKYYLLNRMSSTQPVFRTSLIAFRCVLHTGHWKLVLSASKLDARQ